MKIIIIILILFIFVFISEKNIMEKFSAAQKKETKRKEISDNVSSIRSGTIRMNRKMNRQIEKQREGDSSVPDYWEPCDVCDTLGDDGPTPSECRTLNNTFGKKGTFTKMILEEIPNTIANIGGFFLNAASF